MRATSQEIGRDAYDHSSRDSRTSGREIVQRVVKKWRAITTKTSVIIPTRAYSPKVEKLVELLQEQRTPPYEIIVATASPSRNTTAGPSALDGQARVILQRRTGRAEASECRGHRTVQAGPTISLR